MYARKDSKGRTYRAWGIISPWYDGSPDQYPIWPIMTYRSGAIKEFEAVNGYAWDKARAKGWKCIKLDFVIVGLETGQPS